MQIAAVDIGTNSVHMIVVRVRPDLSFEIIDREKEMVRLGAGGLDGRALTLTAMADALQALSKFRRLADSRRVDEIVASATSAVREADNGVEFLARVADQTGIRARVISGTEEARLIHLAAAYGTHIGGRAVVIDVGGGSTEITLGTAAKMQYGRSFKVGVIRLTERFVRSDPLSRRDERRLEKHILDEVGPYADQIIRRGFQRVIGTSGTILSLGALAAADGSDTLPADVRNLRVGAKAVRRLRRRLLELDLRGRLELPGLDPRRADLSVAGIVLLDTLLDRLGADEITLCDLALREGLVLDYIRRNPRHIATIERYPDVRRRSVIELAERCQAWGDHARHVARLSLRLFDATRRHHGLAAREREWLEFAAILHDIGGHISYKGHHKHSYYLIRNGDLRGFDPDEIEVIGLVARYHRQATPKKSHEGYGGLDPERRRAVRVLSSCLRLAEALDRSHAQVVSDLGVARNGSQAVVQVRSNGDTELELWAAARQRAPFEREAAGAEVRFEVQPRRPGRPTSPAAPAAPPRKRTRRGVRSRKKPARRPRSAGSAT